MQRIEPEEALNQCQGLIKEMKEIEKEENDKQSLRMPSPEEMKEREKGRAESERDREIRLDKKR